MKDSGSVWTSFRRPRGRGHSWPIFVGLTVAIATLSAYPVSSSLASGSTGTTDNTEVLGFVPDLSSATTSTYRDTDATLVSNVYLAPVNYQPDSGGDWQPIDNTLVSAPGAAYDVENAANSFTARIPEDPSTTPVQMSQDGSWVKMRLHGVSDAAAAVDTTSATFDDVSNADSVTYESTNVGLKEAINLDQPPTGAVSYTYSINASPDLTPKLVDGGGVVFADESGAPVFLLPAGTMIDSAASAAVSSQVAFALSQVADGWTLTITPNFDWLTDPSRVYPVAIDPSLVKATDQGDCYLGSMNPDSSHCALGNNTLYLKSGRSDSAHKYRSLLKFNLSSVPTGANVTSATVHMYLDASQTLDPSVSSSYAFFLPGKSYDNSATWNSAGAAGSWSGGSPGFTAYSTTSMTGGTSGDKSFTGFGSLIQSWISGAAFNRGLVFKQVNETDNNVLNFFSASPSNYGKQPYVSVQYTVPPSTPSGLAVTPCTGSCSASGSVTNVWAPTLSALATDADTTTLTYNWQVEDGVTGELLGTGTTTAVQGTTASWQVPAGVMDDVGHGFAFRVSASDDTTSSAWSDWQPFTVVTYPGAALNPAATCGSDCTAVSPSLPLSPSPWSATSGGTQDFPTSISGVDSDVIGNVLVHVTISSASNAGSLQIYDKDYGPGPSPTISYPASPTGSVAAQADVEVPISDEDDITIANSGASSTVAVTLTAWRSWETASEQQVANAEDTTTSNADDDAWNLDVAQADDTDNNEFDPCDNSDPNNPFCDSEYDGTFTQTQLQSYAAFANSAAHQADLAEGVTDGDVVSPGFDASGQPKDGTGACSKVTPKWAVTGRFRACIGTAETFTLGSSGVTIFVYEREWLDPNSLRMKLYRDFALAEADGSLVDVHLHAEDSCSNCTSVNKGVVDCHLVVGGNESCPDATGVADADYPTGSSPSLDTHPQEKVKMTVTQSSSGRTSPPAKVGEPSIRCDGATYFTNFGCVNQYDVPIFQVPVDKAPHAASFYRRAQLGKSLPWGLPLVGAPLQRLTDQKARNRNRRHACRNKNWEKSCDEYPFASTYQGCALLPSACATDDIDLAENKLVGSHLGGFYARSRLSDKDKFYVATS